MPLVPTIDEVSHGSGHLLSNPTFQATVPGTTISGPWPTLGPSVSSPWLYKWSKRTGSRPSQSEGPLCLLGSSSPLREPAWPCSGFSGGVLVKWTYFLFQKHEVAGFEEVWVEMLLCPRLLSGRGKPSKHKWLSAGVSCSSRRLPRPAVLPHAPTCCQASVPSPVRMPPPERLSFSSPRTKTLFVPITLRLEILSSVKPFPVLPKQNDSSFPWPLSSLKSAAFRKPRAGAASPNALHGSSFW